jgi:hypothetical protein
LDVVRSNVNDHVKCLCNDPDYKEEAFKLASATRLSQATRVTLVDFRRCQQLTPNDMDRQALEAFRPILKKFPNMSSKVKPLMSNRTVSVFSRRWLKALTLLGSKQPIQHLHYIGAVLPAIQNLLRDLPVRSLRLEFLLSSILLCKTIETERLGMPSLPFLSPTVTSMQLPAWIDESLDPTVRLETFQLETLLLDFSDSNNQGLAGMYSEENTTQDWQRVMWHRDKNTSLQNFYCHNMETCSTSMIYALRNLILCSTLRNIHFEFHSTNQHHVLLQFLVTLQAMLQRQIQVFGVKTVLPALEHLVIVIYLARSSSDLVEHFERVFRHKMWTLSDTDARFTLEWAIVVLPDATKPVATNTASKPVFAHRSLRSPPTDNLFYM